MKTMMTTTMMNQHHPSNDDIVQDTVGPPPLDPMESGSGSATSFVMDQYQYKQRTPLNLDMFRKQEHQKPKQPPTSRYHHTTTSTSSSSYLPVYVPPNHAPIEATAPSKSHPKMLPSSFDGIRVGGGPTPYYSSSSSSHEKLDVSNGMGMMFQRDAILYDDYQTSGPGKDKKDTKTNSSSCCWKQKMPPKAKEIYWKGSRTPLLPSTTVTKPAPTTTKKAPPPPPSPAPAVVSPCQPSHKKNHPRQSSREDNYDDYNRPSSDTTSSSTNFRPQALANLKRDSFYDSSHHHSIEDEEQRPIIECDDHHQFQQQPQQQPQRWKLTTAAQTSSKMDSVGASLCTSSFPSFYNASFHETSPAVPTTSCSDTNPAEEEPTTLPDAGSEPQPQQLIEIAPGVTAVLRGAKETSLAVRQNYITGVTCWGCQSNIFCVADCLYAICPLCKTISPNDDDTNPTNHGLGLGLSRKALQSLQSEMFGC